MKKHHNYITHINNEEDIVYLRTVHFPVNMRLFKTSEQYKAIIIQQCEYIRSLCLSKKEGYKKPHGMSSANAGLSFNIIGITMFRNTEREYCKIMINPTILNSGKDTIISQSNCGSLTLDKPISVKRSNTITVDYFDENGTYIKEKLTRSTGSLTVQHEIQHNLGILIIDL